MQALASSQALRSCTVSRGLWTATMLEVIALVVRNVYQTSISRSGAWGSWFSCQKSQSQEASSQPPRDNLSFSCLSILCRQSNWAWSHHSQTGNVIKGSFWVPTTPEVLLQGLRKTSCKAPFFFLFLLTDVKSLFLILPLHPGAEQNVLLFWASSEPFEVDGTLFYKGRNWTGDANCSRAEL